MLFKRCIFMRYVRMGWIKYGGFVITLQNQPSGQQPVQVIQSDQRVTVSYKLTVEILTDIGGKTETTADFLGNII